MTARVKTLTDFDGNFDGHFPRAEPRIANFDDFDGQYLRGHARTNERGDGSVMGLDGFELSDLGNA